MKSEAKLRGSRFRKLHHCHDLTTRLNQSRTAPIVFLGLDGRVFGQIKQTTRLWTPLSAPDLSRSANEGCAAPRVAHGEICSTSFQFEVVSRDAVYTVNASTNVHPYGYFP